MRMKHLLIGVGAVAAGVVAAGAVLIATLDPNDHRAEIEARLGSALGRAVTLGPLDLRLGLTPRLVARDITIANPGGGEMARVGELGISLDLWSVVVGTPRIEAVTVARAAVLFEIDAQGRANWQFGRERAPAAPAEPGRPAQPSAPRPIQLDRLALSDVAITYRDLRRNRSVPIVITSATAAITPGQSTPVEVTGSVAGRALRLTGSVPALDQLDAPAPLQLGGVVVGIEVAATGRVTARAPSGDVRFAVTVPTLASLSAFGVEVPAVAASLGPVKLGGRLVADAATARLDDVVLSVAGPDAAEITLKAAGTVGAAIDLALEVAVRHGARFPAGLPALGPWTGSGRLTGQPQALALDDLKLSAAGTMATGRLDLATGGTRPAVTATVQIDQITIPAPTPAAEPARGAAAPAPAPADRLIPAIPLPLAGLMALDAKVAATLGRLVTSGGEIADIALGLDLTNGVLRVSRADAGLAGGRVQATGRMTSAGATEINLEADDLALGALGRLLGRDIPLTATADVRLALSGRGRDVRALAASLDGRASLVIGRGQVAMTLIRGLGLPQQLLALLGQDISDLRCLVVRTTLSDGVATLGTMVAGLAPAVVVGQGGRISLVDERIEVRVVPRSANPLLASALPPLIVSGTLAAPRVAPDAGATAGAVAGIAGVLLGQQPATPVALPDYCGAAVAGEPLPTAPASAPAPAAPSTAPRAPSLPGVLDQLLRR